MCMQKLGEPHYCGRKHQTTGDLKRSSSPSALSSCFQLTPICLLPRLSCLSLVRLDKSLGKTVLCETCVVLEVKWAQKVLCSAGALWRIIINSAHNNTLDFEDKCSCPYTHTNTDKEHLGRVKVDCREDWKVGGHLKWRCTGPDLAPGMVRKRAEGRMRGNSQVENTCKVKCTPSSST